MQKKENRLISWFKAHLPLAAVIAVALIVAVRNIDPGTIFSGWDNLHPEFDFTRYVRQVVFGAWIEHHGLGSPAAQGHLAEIFRLPILFLFQIFLPANLHRYVFIFLMYLIGGVGMYLYLSQVWLKEKTGFLKNWLASLGGIFYLLHILTLQQFYISFEMFTVQFAFLPFLLLTTYRLAQKQNTKNWLWFALIQFLIAPSGHTPTVFYLGAMVSVAYAFFLTLRKSFVKAISFSFLIGAATLLINGYWTIPSLYYMANDSHYVHESRDNWAFSPESAAAVREMGTVDNFLAGTQFLFNWKDYSFENHRFEPVFNEWEGFLYQPHVQLLLQFFGVLNVVGIILSIRDGRKDHSRWAMVLVFFGCMAMLWTDVLPIGWFVNKLYESDSFMEVFRNPFTKLSIIYTAMVVLFFARAAEWLVTKISMKNAKPICVGLLIGAIMYTAWPSFQGHFLNDRLKITYPSQYQEMFSYLKTRNRDLRVLQLPQFGHVGWEFYDWSFLGEGNGYQGMGFYMFGMPQAFLNRDADRWVETNDFFYHELKAATDSQNIEQLKRVFEKYNVDLLIIDETKIDPNKTHDFSIDYQLAEESGFTKVWHKDFLTIYERQAVDLESEILTPDNVIFAAADTNRVRADAVYTGEGDYLMTNEKEAQVIYPFANLSAHQLENTMVTQNGVDVIQAVESGQYTVTVPGASGNTYFTPAAITYENDMVSVIFPKVVLTAGKTMELPKLPDLRFPVQSDAHTLVLFFNDIGVTISEGETVSPVLRMFVGQSLSVEYAPAVEGTDISTLPTTTAMILEPEWEKLTSGVFLEKQPLENIRLSVVFPALSLNLMRSPSENCSVPKKGSVLTTRTVEGVLFQADAFGVNCNGYDFDYISPAYSYAAHITGENLRGRGVKFFVNYGNYEIVPEDYLMRGTNIGEVLTLAQLSADPTETMTLNWETRSFGKFSESMVRSIDVVPLPIEQFSQLQLSREGGPLANSARVVSEKNYFDVLRVVDVRCDGEQCFIGLDQSYDDAWVAFQVRGGLLKHFRLNTWSNGWKVVHSGRVIIVYLPELAAVAGLVGVVVFGAVVLRRVR